MATLPGGSKLTWLGHATFIVETPAGTRLLIDPWVMQNPSCPDDLKDPGDIDVMLITHAHWDHIADAEQIAKDKGCKVLAIPEIASWVGDKGVDEGNLIGFNKGGTVEVAGIRAHMTHAVHSCGLPDGTYGGEAAGYVVEFEDGFRLYHSGDTAVFSDMALIGKLLAPDVALLPIGDHFTMGPRSAAEAIRLLGVTTVVPMHFGTFPVLTGTPDALREEAADVSGLEIVELKPGDTLD
jgi:L-ascorbate metabolism protein UlaG (beta-lactamase superfamily)